MAVSSPLLSLPMMDVDRQRVETALLQSVKTRDAHLNELAAHLIVAGGKRLRPVMTVAAASVGRDKPVTDDVIQGAISCELVHLGSLYHDDVMDESATRRGVETVNSRWGNLQAILAGDFLLAKASEIAAALGTEVASLLARTIGHLCEGQIEELTKAFDVSRSVPSYLVSIEGKTASLFSTSARVGALVAGHERNVVEALTNYGTAYGMVFQIVDDILDVIATDAELGKRAGHDMEEGVYTLPVLLTLKSDSPDSLELRDLLGRPFSGDERDTALAIVRANSGVANAIETAREYVAIAEAECAKLPKSEATTA
ncbi:MAG: polyprenyl synthetase family protein, partial [Actinobacteria bacterium]|nr:polyprenyl synthetase family protein [Actinomycetota bacterium]